MASPKKDMGGTLMRYTVSKGKDGQLDRSQEFKEDGYHDKPTGGASPTKHGSKRKDFPFLPHSTTKGKC